MSEAVIQALQKKCELYKTLNAGLREAFSLLNAINEKVLKINFAYCEQNDVLAKEVKKLEEEREQLIEAGRALTRVAEWRYTNLPELLAWDTLVDDIRKRSGKCTNIHH